MSKTYKDSKGAKASKEKNKKPKMEPYKKGTKKYDID